MVQLIGEDTENIYGEIPVSFNIYKIGVYFFHKKAYNNLNHGKDIGEKWKTTRRERKL